jgi:flagellum-specific ATP synthase
MTAVTSREHVAAARRLRQLLARYNKARDLIQLGAYAPGHDPELDAAVRLQPAIEQFLQQDMVEQSRLDSSLSHLAQALSS